MPKYKLRTNDTLKCAACGNKEFEQRHIQRDSKDKWVYTCTNCGHMMHFTTGLEEKEGLLS